MKHGKKERARKGKEIWTGGHKKSKAECQHYICALMHLGIRV